MCHLSNCVLVEACKGYPNNLVFAIESAIWLIDRNSLCHCVCVNRPIYHSGEILISMKKRDSIIKTTQRLFRCLLPTDDVRWYNLYKGSG